MDARPELLRLLAVARDDLDDAGARLVLADWLEEHGDEADRLRATALRLQLELEALPDGDPDYTFGARLDQLRWEPALRLPPELNSRAHQVWYVGGFFGLFLRDSALNDPVIVAFAGTEIWGWVGEVLVGPTNVPYLAALTTSPLLAGLPSLWTYHSALTDEQLGELARADNFRELRRLRASGPTLGDGGAQRLAASGLRLTHLSLVQTRLTGSGLADLAASPVTAGLRDLDLKGSPIGLGGVRALLRGRPAGLPASLRSLSLRECRLGDAGVEALVQSPSVASLTSLDLERNDLGPGGFQALLASPHLDGLRKLAVGANHPGRLRDALTARFGARILFDEEIPF